MSSYKKKTSPSLPKKYRKMFSFCRQQILNEYSNLLVGCENDFYVSDLQINFYSSHTFLKLISLFASNRVKEILEGKDFDAIDASVPFVATFISRATGYSEEPL